MPFVSKSQSRACWARYHQDLKAGRKPAWDCQEFADATPSIKDLPEKAAGVGGAAKALRGRMDPWLRSQGLPGVRTTQVGEHIRGSLQLPTYAPPMAPEHGQIMDALPGRTGIPTTSGAVSLHTIRDLPVDTALPHPQPLFAAAHEFAHASGAGAPPGALAALQAQAPRRAQESAARGPGEQHADGLAHAFLEHLRGTNPAAYQALAARFEHARLASPSAREYAEGITQKVKDHLGITSDEDLLARGPALIGLGPPPGKIAMLPIPPPRPHPTNVLIEQRAAAREALGHAQAAEAAAHTQPVPPAEWAQRGAALRDAHAQLKALPPLPIQDHDISTLQAMMNEDHKLGSAALRLFL